MTAASNSETILSDIAQEINKNNTSLLDCRVKSLLHGCRIGQLLLDAKKILPHGRFLDWVKTNTSVTPRMCQCYMAVSRDARLTWALEHEYETVSHLSLTAAVKLASPSKASVKKARKSIAREINAKWARAGQLRQDWVRCVSEARQDFAGDDEFKSWLMANANIGAAFAEKIPDLLKGEFDDAAWTDAMLADIEAQMSAEARP